MPLFWFLLGMLTTLAMLCVLLPWIRTIPSFASLPSVPWQAPLAALLMLIAAVVIYRWLGRPELAAATVAAAPTASMGGAAAPSPGSASSMQTALASLEGKLAKGGGSDGDWDLLAKSYEFLARPEDAAKARTHVLASSSGSAQPPSTAVAEPTLSQESLALLAKASKARADKHYSAAVNIYSQLAARQQLTADGWADYADAAASVQEGKLAGMPESYVDNALALNPKHPKALWLKASAAEEAGRMSAAVRYWQQLQSVLPPESEDAKIVAANLQRDADSAAADAAGKIQQPTSSDHGAEVSGEVTLANSLTGKAAPGGTLFIFAKAAESPGAPLAVFRGSVGAWPVKFRLDDSQSMLPGHNLSSTARVTVEARVSQSGQATPASGDLRGSSGVINPADREPLKIVINEVIK
jgi:cytochrome c-type biogenesis protein CcmH/NrfG